MGEFSEATDQPVPFEFEGVTYGIHPMTLKDFGFIESWLDDQVNRQVPGAYDGLKELLPGLPIPSQQFLLREIAQQAGRRKTCPIASPEADALLSSYAGATELFHVRVRRGDPTMTREKAAEIVGRFSQDDLIRFMGLQQSADGGGAAGEDGGTDAPKASTSGGSTGP